MNYHPYPALPCSAQSSLPAPHCRSLPFCQDRELFQHGFRGSLPPLLALLTRVETNGLLVTFFCNLSIWLLLHIGRQFFVNIVKDILSTWQSSLNGDWLMSPKLWYAVVHPKMALGNKQSGEVCYLCQRQSFFHHCLGPLNLGFCCRFTMAIGCLAGGPSPLKVEKIEPKMSDSVTSMSHRPC